MVDLIMKLILSMFDVFWGALICAEFNILYLVYSKCHRRNLSSI